MALCVLGACTDQRRGLSSGGGGGSGGPLPITRDSGSGDGTLGTGTSLTCQTISAPDPNNSITLQSSSAALEFQLSYVYAEWNCAIPEPTLIVGMSDSACNDIAGQRLVMRIPIPARSADAVVIAESATYARPAGYTPQGRCGFDEGTFTFASGDASHLTSTFSLTSSLLGCDGGLATDMLYANGAFDIELPGARDQACD
ncbi:MAG: hypothetical protein H6714_05730 [Myxococcales bacterium]|nr:hypothetical protein [Myxococcales bacterium]